MCEIAYVITFYLFHLSNKPIKNIFYIHIIIVPTSIIIINFKYVFLQVLLKLSLCTNITYTIILSA